MAETCPRRDELTGAVLRSFALPARVLLTCEDEPAGVPAPPTRLLPISLPRHVPSPTPTRLLLIRLLNTSSYNVPFSDTPLFRRIFRGLHARADDMSASDASSLRYVLHRYAEPSFDAASFYDAASYRSFYKTKFKHFCN